MVTFIWAACPVKWLIFMSQAFNTPADSNVRLSANQLVERHGRILIFTSKAFSIVGFVNCSLTWSELSGVCGRPSRGHSGGDGRKTLEHETAGFDWHPRDTGELRHCSLAGAEGMSLHTTDSLFCIILTIYFKRAGIEKISKQCWVRIIYFSASWILFFSWREGVSAFKCIKWNVCLFLIHTKKQFNDLQSVLFIHACMHSSICCISSFLISNLQ